MSCTTAYPEIDFSELSQAGSGIEHGIAELVDATIFLVGAPSEAKAKEVLGAFGKKFPDTIGVDLCWLRSSIAAEKQFATKSSELVGERTWAKLDPADSLFKGVARPKTSGHNVFVLFYSRESPEDPTVLCNELVRSGFSEHLHPSAMIVPVADYLIDPRTEGAKRIPVSKNGPLAEVKVSGKTLRVPYNAGQIHLIPLDKILAKGTGKDSLGARNSGTTLGEFVLMAIGLFLGFGGFVVLLILLVAKFVMPLLKWLDNRSWL